jgi:Na+/proline symporter
VVENSSPEEVSRARWLFPLYLVAINLFVIPIALAGLITFPFGAIDSDMYVLALPIEGNSPLLSVGVFVGGLSAATAMVIVECVALSIMVSNDIVLPLVLQRSPGGHPAQQDFGDFLLKVRRFAIFAIMVMAYFYYRALGNTQLAAIGLLSFAAIAQLAPAFFGGLFWRRAAPWAACWSASRCGSTRCSCRASSRPAPRGCNCCSTDRSASTRCGRRRCSAPTCRRCCTACCGRSRSIS